MAKLLDILNSREEAICRAMSERLTSGEVGGLESTQSGRIRTLLNTMVSVLRTGNVAGARRWAQAMSEEAAREEITYRHVNGGFRLLETSIRHEILAQFESRPEAVLLLDETSEAIDVLRRTYAESHFDSDEKHQPRPHEFSAVVDATGECVCLATRHGRPFYLNAAARKIIGLDPDETINFSSLRDFHTEETWRIFQEEAVPEVSRKGRWSGTACVHNRRTSEVTEVQTRMFLIRGPQTGRSTSLALLYLPSGAELKQALAESETRKHAILESSLDPIITIDHEGRITEFNRAAEQVLGYSRQEVLGTRPSEVLFPPSKIEGHRDRIDRYLEAGEGSMLGKRFDVTAVRSNGETFAAEMAMTLNYQDGLPVLTFFVRDISQRKKAEKEQARYAADLIRSNRELEQFAYAASHDLQEPLRKIRTFGDRLQSKCGEALDETGTDCLQRMLNAAERMQDLISGLLTLSRVTTKGQGFVRVDLALVTSEVVNDLEIQIEQAEGRVEIGKMPTIHADPLQMRQLLQNLIGNALKFRRPEEPPLVKVHAKFLHGRDGGKQRVAAEQEQCLLVVEDNGIGFDEKYLDRIFNVFQRLHPRDVYKGTGVGLAICRKIVERHGGTITAKSAPGEGARFEVVVPVVHPKGDKNQREDGAQP